MGSPFQIHKNGGTKQWLNTALCVTPTPTAPITVNDVLKKRRKRGNAMKFYISLNRDEIQEQIPYAIVAETMSRSVWNTGKRKRLMKQRFTEAEIEATYRLHRIARDWCLYKGVPDEATMTISTYDLWQKLANFCCEI